MRTRGSVVGLAYLLSVLLGNVCLLQLTQSITPPTAQDAPALSRMDAKDCPFVKMGMIGMEEGKKNPCASGHCITSPAPEISLFAPGVKADTAPSITVALAPAHSLIASTTEDTLSPQTERPPPLHGGMTSVVLRL